MSRWGLRLAGVATALGVLLSTAACGSDDSASSGAGSGGGTATVPSTYPSDYEATIEAGTKEGKVVVYGVMAEEQWAPILEGFNALYPEIEVQTLDLGTNEVFERQYAEQAAGSPGADLIQTVSADGWHTFAQERKQTLEYASPEEPEFLDFVEPLPGVFVMSTDPLVIASSTATLAEDQRPTSIEQLVELAKEQPELYDGKITTFGVEEFYASWHAIAGAAGPKFDDWFEVLGPMTRVESSAGPMMEKILSGEYSTAYFTSLGGVLPLTEGPQAKLFQWSLISDSQPVLQRSIGIPKDAEHPNAAKLLVDYLLSAQGQSTFPAGGLTPWRPDGDYPDDAMTYQKVQEVAGDHVVHVGPDPALLKDFDPFVARWNALFER